MKKEKEKIEKTYRLGSVKYVVSIEPREISVDVYTYPDDKDEINYETMSSWVAIWPKRSSYAKVIYGGQDVMRRTGSLYQLPSIPSIYFRWIVMDTTKRLRKLTDNDPAIRKTARDMIRALGGVSLKIKR